MQILTPAVQHREKADLGAQMFGIGGDGAQRLGGGPEQDRVDVACSAGPGGDLGGSVNTT